MILGAAVTGASQERDSLALRVEDAVRLGLERNLDLTIERYEVPIAQEQTRRAASDFDPRVQLSATGGRQELPVNSALEQQAEGGTIVEESVIPEVGLGGKFLTGTRYNLSLVTPVVETNNPNRRFDQYYRPVLTLGLAQPLLKEFGIEVNVVRIRQAERTERIASYGIEAKMLTVIRDVETSYWTLFFAEQHVRVAEGSLELARDLVERLRRMAAAGLATALDVRQGEVGVEVRRADQLRAEADLLNAQVQLRLLTDPGRSGRIVAVDAPPEERPPVDLAGKLARAVAQRPEILRQELTIENLVLQEMLDKNNTLPSLDVVGSLGYTGLAGRGTGPAITDPAAASRGQGSYFDAFNDGNFTWSLGLRLQVPLGNRDALGRLEQTRLRLGQERVRLSLLKSQISVEVETAFQDMTAAWGQVMAAAAGVAVAREQLDAQERQLAAGLTTVRRVLEAQDEVARAQDQRIQALVRYGTARSRLAAAAGSSFETYRLVVRR
ncbi:MAG: TolC family protein [Candidatus Rokubacteria bacterium]|nr:TolC family protein [Candidatus Rokubacteria bacterium]